MVEITKMEAEYIRPKVPYCVIYRTTHNHYFMSEESTAIRALEMFRKLSITEQEYIVRQRKF